MAIEEVVLGGGCFWCLEAIFQETRGVLDVQSGYSGGALDNPDYHSVCSGASGHAEVVKLRFDNELITLRELLEIFFTMHDPTTLNRQGNDVGTQYRSVVYYCQASQLAQVQAVMAAMAGVWDAPLVTEVKALENWYPAEAHHQNYFRRHAEQGYCAIVIAPKVAKFRQIFAARSKV
ncbi:peptide-methionine (S)-S-oxide reductase MsrA [Massilia sp. W12]|uniref:peptide-methionine (S)-S-oxide reductase MsrA n=1 Tax=Massilia sp. W12 TaxID=3126507 RepID=UPI0030D5ED5F